MNSACVGLGSNLDPAGNLPAALDRLGQLVAVEAVSSAWESPAVGPPAPDFVNAAVLVRTPLPEDELVALLKRVEDRMGRARGGRSTRVAIDLDLLVFNDEVRRPDLWSLAYRAVPVAEFLPDLTSPETGEALSRAAERHRAAGAIRPRPDIPLDPASPDPSRAATRHPREAIRWRP